MVVVDNHGVENEEDGGGRHDVANKGGGGRQTRHVRVERPWYHRYAGGGCWWWQTRVVGWERNGGACLGAIWRCWVLAGSNVVH